MLPVEKMVVNCGPLSHFLVHCEDLDKGEAAHNLHHVALIIDRLAASALLFFTPHIRRQVSSRILAKVMTCLLVILVSRALHDFSADS